jgi:hypothetical protein
MNEGGYHSGREDFMPSANSPRAPRFQFSLAALLLLITVTAVFLGLVTTVAGSILFLVFSWIILYILPTVILVWAIYGSGDVRAFAIGALVPIVAFTIQGQTAAGHSFMERTIGLAATSGVCGLVASITRRWLLENRGDSE